MAEGGHPSVFVVDSHATRPPLPPRLSQGRRRAGGAQTLLFLLVSLALCGMVIEAYFIYQLHQRKSENSASFSKFTGPHTDVATTPTNQPSEDGPPSKPAAHLTDGQDVVHGKQIMSWSMDADPLLYEIGYKDGSLIIQKPGYYYVYSKVFFSDKGVFYHLVEMHTEKYPGKNISLLQSRTYSSEVSRMRSNSYLGGVFHLDKNDAVYVNVSSTAKIQRHKSYENVFGAYMI